jgi:TonB-dependent SusC/RagA subfamily outer membrane receptor
MPKLYFLYCFLFCVTLNAQNFDSDWKTVYKFELDGKIESAQKEVGVIYKKARRKKDNYTVLKCFFYLSKFEQVFDENAQSTIILNLKNEIKTASKENKSLLYYVYVKILTDYQNANRYQINKRTSVENNKNDDFLTWSAADFRTEIQKCYDELLKNKKELRAISIEDYKDIFEYSSNIDAKNYTLYDFLYEKKLKYYNEFTFWNRNDKSFDFEKTFNLSPNEFVQIKISDIKDKSIAKFVELLQENEIHLIENNLYNQLDYAFYNRLKIANQKTNTNKRIQLNALEKQTKNIYLKQELKADRAAYLTYKQADSLNINYKQKALILIDSIFQIKTNADALSRAENLRNEIIKKSLNIQLTKTIYPFEKNRAFVNFKNVDSIKISYYKFPIALNEALNKYNNIMKINTDSLVIDFVSKNKAYQNYTRILPKKTDFNYHSTEILLEDVASGNYLVFMETNNYSKLKDTVSNAFSYEIVKATQFIVIEDEDETNDLLYLYDRKSGKPIENASIIGELGQYKSDKNGKVSIKKSMYNTDYKQNNQITIFKENDTLIHNYNRSYVYKNKGKDDDDEFENYEAKAMVFFDRAIYRPGQKMFYKGVLVEKKEEIKSVVPFVTVHVTIYSPENTALKEFDVQTNKFGSFSGEFDIPKNSLTGRFYMEIEEPNNYEKDNKYYDKNEDEHSFWDFVDFYDNSEYNFQVEEYKRPTFEVTFNEIKENYTIGDSLQIVGNAKALAGNNLTNAKVSYTVSRSYTTKKNEWNTDNNFINEEIFTDSDGNFVIPIGAKLDSITNDKIDNFRFSINVSVTDSNGETRTATEEILVNQKTLKLNIVAANIVNAEDPKALQIKSTTYNNFPIDSKGEIKIYRLKYKEFLKQRTFIYPEIQEIERTLFETLFPYEPYNQSDYETERILIKTIPFDTEISKEVSLDFLKNENPSRYEILAHSFDSKNNKIEDVSEFRLVSKENPVSNSQLFTYKDISKKEGNYFEIEIQSVIPDLYITHRYYADKEDLQQEVTQQLVHGKTVFKIKKEKEYKNNVNFHFSAFWENQSHEQRYSISKEKTETKLNIEVTSLRNKIEPGSKENWSFKILNSKLQAEVLASMYDSSLDQFTTKDWENVYFNLDENYYNSPQIYIRKNNSYTYFTNFYLQKKYFENYKRNPEMYWFGFNFNDANNRRNYNEYYNQISQKVIVPKSAKSISGIVYDVDGPIAGATITIKGTKRGVTTDFDGNFFIDAVKGETLIASYIGSLKEIIITSSKNYEIELVATNLDEIVVIGYGSTTKEAYVGSAITYDGYMARDKDGLNDEEYLYRDGDFKFLRGRVSGVQVIDESGAPGSDATIRIRGFGSVYGNKNPLYVVDGVPFNEEVVDINLQNIETITILKDKEATSIYGNRGANGVIIITTKNVLNTLAQAKTRTNFNETAFFYPNLKTDINGKISFEFTSPESLTQWKLRLFAHNKNAEVGAFETKIISQKEVMVQTNMPRFVREKDEIKISAKVVNMTLESKYGIAMLQLFDAATNTIIDEICANKNNIKNFICKPKESVPVEWIIQIPEGLQGLQYKIVAKSGNFSDGEENILPVLSNKILIAESIPIWVKGATKKEYEFSNLKNNTSTTLKSHLFTLEYTSNPTWLALQSLPYLMEYEHECAEQTFSRYYANYIATQIIDNNPKIAALFETWKKEGKLISKLKMNEELKSIVLAETPWLLDAENDESKNNRLALLMDLNSMKEAMEITLKKLKEKQKTSGAFSWFEGGEDNVYITQHIIKGLGHLAKLFPGKDSIYTSILDKAIPFLDKNYINNNSLKNKRIDYYTYSDLHYLYTRSFYQKKYPVSTKIDSIIAIQKVEFKKDWLTYNLYSKALLALTMHRFGDKAFAKKILTNLKETAARNEDNGMYWIENTNGYYWYQNAIETQAILIEAFAEIENDDKITEELKVWLLKNKQVNKWSTTKSTTEAVYALLLQGSDWISIKDNTKFTIGNEKVFTKKLSEKDKEAETGYIKLNWNAEEITQEMGTIKVENKSKVPGYGGVYWHYFENLENIKTDSTKVLNINKTVYKKTKTTNGNELIELNKEQLKTGDLITIRLIIKTESDLEFVHLKDLRASCFEPVNVISNYEWKENVSYYKSTKDVATHFFFDKINKGTYVLEYDVRINNSGVFNDGVATIQSMYAPEFSAHSRNTTITID